jgi:hypothetical protein
MRLNPPKQRYDWAVWAGLALATAAAVLFIARRSHAQAAGSEYTREVLVLASAATDLSRANGSASISVDNYGPNAIWCGLGKSTNAVVNKSKRVQPGETWAVDLPSTVKVWCRAATADQVTGAATVVNEATK